MLRFLSGVNTNASTPTLPPIFAWRELVVGLLPNWERQSEKHYHFQSRTELNCFFVKKLDEKEMGASSGIRRRAFLPSTPKAGGLVQTKQNAIRTSSHHYFPVFNSLEEAFERVWLERYPGEASWQPVSTTVTVIWSPVDREKEKRQRARTHAQQTKQ